MMRSERWLLIRILVFVCGATPLPCVAAAIRAAPHNGYGRIVFDWDGPVRYDADVVDNRAVFRFSTPLLPVPTVIPQRLPRYVSAVSLSADRRTLTLVLRDSYAMNAFTIGSSVVIDLADRVPTAAGPRPKNSSHPTPAPPPPKVPPPAPKAKPARLAVRVGRHLEYDRVVFDWPTAPRYDVDKRAASIVLQFGQSASVDEAAVRRALPAPLKAFAVRDSAKGLTVTLPVPDGRKALWFNLGPKVVVDVYRAEALPKPEPAEAPAPPSPPPHASPPLETTLSPHGPPSAPTSGSTLQENAGHTAPLPTPARGAERKQQPIMSSPTATIDFSWDKPVAAAIFRRSGWLWLVFDQPSHLEIEELRRAGEGVAQHIEQQPNPSATIVRMLVAPGVNPSIRREGAIWHVDLAPQPYRPRQVVAVQPQPQGPDGPRLLATINGGGRAMAIVDPDVGDTFIVAPVLEEGHGVYPAHLYPDVRLPITAQGVVIEPKSDDMTVNVALDGLSITLPDPGLILSDDLDVIRTMARIGADTDLERIFDVASWARGPDADFDTTRQTLQRAVAHAPPKRRDNARLELARFYFAHGFATEALGVLRAMAKDNPAVEQLPAFLALRGGANLLMGRYREAEADLGQPSLSGYDEAVFWHAAAQSHIEDPSLQAETLRKASAVIAPYPRWVKVPLALTGARAAAAIADSVGTAAFLNAAKVENNTPRETAAMKYYAAQVLEAQGEYDQALGAYAEAAAGGDRFFRAMATRAGLELSYRLEKISRAQLIEQLEQLRFVWRGGEFEFKLLMRLGELYEQERAFGDALRTWRQATAYFDDRAEGAVATRRMGDAFQELFLDGAADDLSPVQAISLYDDFRELTPSGEKGDDMVRRLADRLVGVDLLPQAAALLDRQVTYRLSGLEKARVGARLGLVRLLNKEPRAAVEALLKSDFIDAPPSLSAQRTRLMARGLADIGRAEEAIILLENDTSRLADSLRAEIYWTQGQWQKAGQAFAQLVPQASPDLALSTENSRLLLNWAAAAVLDGDKAATTKLRRLYSPAMNKTSFADAFDLITSPTEDGVIDYRTVGDRVRQVEDFRAFLSGYQEQVKNEGLSAIN